MNFRRWITALAVLTLFVGLAAAQTSGGGTALTCATVAQVTPTIRSEGITELVGDIVITCQGGTQVAPGTAIPQGNIVVSLTNSLANGITSRLQTGGAPAGAAGIPSEALLMVDEPNSGLLGPVPNFGPGAPLNVCTTPGQGCVEYATSVAGTGGTYIVATDTVGGTVAGRNVFQGNVAGNTVSFQGIPFLPPVTAGVVRVYRITNIRVNATGTGASPVSGITPVNAYISTNGASTLPINLNNGLTVAFASASLNPTISTKNAAKFTQCSAPSPAPGNVALLNFSELFPSAFKTRVAPFGTTSTSYIGTSSAAGYTQNVPGQLYASESGFILNVGSGTGNQSIQAGLADFGTRFKAVFNNLPTGATLYVSQTNVTDFGTAAPAPTVVGGYNILQTAYATFTAGGEAGAFTAPTNVSGGNVGLGTSSGTATAVWEVINTNTSANETFSFAAYLGYVPNTTAGTPTLTSAAGGPTVTLSYAPTVPPTTALSIPRFIVGTNSTAQSIINIVPCNTILLFPYVTSMGGFDTGIAISNTSMDPLGTATSTGSCTLNFYGLNAPTTPPVLGPIAPGNPDPTKAAFTTSSLAPNFQGYMFAACNFQYAHGFAFVSDIGARNLAMGYLALIVNNGVSVNRGTSSAEALEN